MKEDKPLFKFTIFQNVAYSSPKQDPQTKHAKAFCNAKLKRLVWMLTVSGYLEASEEETRN